MEIIPKEPGSEQLIYQGSAELITLRGQSGQTVKVPIGAEKVVQWLPTDRRATDLEVRFSVISWTLQPGAFANADPDVRWQVEFGHGNTIWTYPHRSYPSFPEIELIHRPYVPARGQVLRLPARELSLKLQFFGMLTENPAVTPWVDVTFGVSFQPVIGMKKATTIAHSLFIQPAGTAIKHHQFPADATEWKLYDQYGKPWEVGNEDVCFYSIAGATTNVFSDRSAFADWTPISARYLTWALRSTASQHEFFGASYR